MKYLRFLLRLFVCAWIAGPFWFWEFLPGFLGRNVVNFSKQKLVLESSLVLTVWLFAVSCDFLALWVNKFELEELDDFRVIALE